MESTGTKTTAAAVKVSNEKDTTDATLKNPISMVTDLILYPIGYATDDTTLASWTRSTADAVRRNSNLSPLECIVKDGVYTPEESIAEPVREHTYLRPKEPRISGDSAIDNRNAEEFNEEIELWEKHDAMYTRNMKTFSKRHEHWHLIEDEKRRKFPQLYQFMVDRISILSQDLIATRMGMDWESINSRQDPIEIRQHIYVTHSAVSTGVRILDQLDTFKNLLNSKMKETERVREYYLIFQAKVRAALEMDCPKLSDAMLCAIFLNSLPERFGPIVRTFKQDAMMAKHRYPSNTIDCLSVIVNYEKERKPSAAISGGGASSIYSMNDEVERESDTVKVPRKKPKKKGICYDYNEGKCELGDECYFQHNKAPKKILDEQRMEAKVAKKNKTTSQVKKCKACDGDHRVEKCPIMLRGNKALKDQEEAGDEVNSMYLLRYRTTSTSSAPRRPNGRESLKQRSCPKHS